MSEQESRLFPLTGGDGLSDHSRMGLWLSRCCLITKSCSALCDPVNCNTAGPPVLHHLLEFAQTSTDSVMPCSRLILCPPLLLRPSIFPIIRVLSNELALRIRWPEYWSFSFKISLSSEHPRLISLQSEGLSESFSSLWWLAIGRPLWPMLLRCSAHSGT